MSHFSFLSVSKSNRNVQNIPEHQRLRVFVLFLLSTTWLNSTVFKEVNTLATDKTTVQSSEQYIYVHTAAPNTAAELLDLSLQRTTQIYFLIRNSEEILEQAGAELCQAQES